MLKIMIGNEEVVSDKNITIKEEMLSTSSTILNNCYPKSWEIDKDYSSRFYYPEDYSKCTIERIENGDSELIFSGIVKNTSDISLNPREPKYCSIQILDNKTLLSEGDTLDFVISNKTINQAIEMIVNTVATYGFVLGNININNGDDVIGAYSTFNKTAYDVFQYLAEISGSKWGVRVIDENTRAIDFYDPTLMPRASAIEYTKQWAETNDIVDISFRYGTYDYRNKQVILSDKVSADIDYTETFVADSYTRTFNVSTPINQVKQVLINGVAVSVASDKAKEIGVYADFYYKIDGTAVTSNESNQPYTSGTIITVIYNPLIKGRQMAINDDEVNRVGTNLSLNGIIARYENRNDVDNSDKLLSIAETYLKFKGQAEITLTITTHNNNLFEVGQIAYFNAPINELATDYMVKSKETNIISVGNNTYEVFYTYQLSSSFNSEKAINWFDNQRNKTMGNIEDGEFISRNIDINNSANVIWDNLQVNEITIDDSYPYENTLESGIETILEG